MGAQFQPAPPAAITRVLRTFDRNQLAAFVEVAIGLLDVADGDADAEDDDPDMVDGDEEDQGAPEGWRLHRLRGLQLLEDTEDDDPAGDPLDEGEVDLSHGGECNDYGDDQRMPLSADGRPNSWVDGESWKL